MPSIFRRSEIAVWMVPGWTPTTLWTGWQVSRHFWTAANQETFLVVQVETPEAIANIEKIAATPGLDGIFVGPGDLGLRIRRTNTDLTLEAAFEKVAAACARHGVAWGTPVGTPEDLAKRQAQGAQLLNYGSDFAGMLNNLKTCAQTFADTPRKS